MKISVLDQKSSYALGEEALFCIEGPDPYPALELCLSNDGFRVLNQQPLILKDGSATVKGTLGEPGILRCRVNYCEDGKNKSLIAAVAFEPERIEPTTTEPEGFDLFWQEQKQQLASVPVDVTLTEVPELSQGKPYIFYEISLACIEGTQLKGYLAKPKSTSPAPAILTLQNHGGGAWSLPGEWVTDFASMGFLAMAMNTHDVENGREQSYYDELNRGPLASYTLRGFLDRDAYYFKTVYLRIVRAIDYLTSLPEWDSKTMILTGRSQGGGLSLVGAGLDPRVTGMVCAVPALCEHGGHKYGRPAGWPRFVPYDELDYGRNCFDATGNQHGPVSNTVWEVSRYYDAVNFARKIRCPVVVNFGMIDTTVPPTTVLSAYNVIETQKTSIVSPKLGHGADRDPEYRRNDFIVEMAKQTSESFVLNDGGS